MDGVEQRHRLFRLVGLQRPDQMQHEAEVTCINAGHFALASCTRFSPKARCPASITGEMVSAPNVFETAISVTEPGSRRASLQARAISSLTAARPFGECAVNGDGVCGVMAADRPWIY